MAEQTSTGSRPGRSGATTRMLVAIAALGLLLGLGAGDALGAVTWTGDWSRFEHPGVLTLNQTGPTTAEGSFTWSGGGTVTGVVTYEGPPGRLRLTGAWKDGFDPPRTGRFSIVMNRSLKSYEGDWGWGTSATDGGPFTGACIDGACVRNEYAGPLPKYPWITGPRSLRKLWVSAGSRKTAVIRRLAREYRRARNSKPGSRRRIRALREMERHIDDYNQLRFLLKVRINRAEPSTVSSCLTWARLHNKTMLRRTRQLRLLHRAIAARPQTLRTVAARKRHFKEQNRLARVNQRYSRRVLNCIRSSS